MFLRRVAIAVLLVSVLFGSFFITLWLTAPKDTRSDADRLAIYSIANDAELTKAAEHAALQPSQSLLGHVDSLARSGQVEVTAHGWFADPNADATSLHVVVFDRGSMVGRTLTKGERADVTKDQHLAGGAEKNVSFSVTFECHSGDQPIVVGIGASHRYLHLPSDRCP